MNTHTQPSRPFTPPSTPPSSSPKKNAMAMATAPHNAILTPPRTPKSEIVDPVTVDSPQQLDALPGEIVTFVGPYSATDSVAQLFSERHVVNQLDPSYRSHLNSRILQASTYIIIPSAIDNLSTVLCRLTPLLRLGTTVVLYGSLPATTVRSALGSLLLDRQLKGGIIIPDAEGPIIAGLESIAPNSTNTIAWVCQGLLSQHQLVSSPETAECVIRFREGRRKLLQAWEAEMRGFCADAGVNSAEVLPNHRPDYWQQETQDKSEGVLGTQHDWQDGLVAGAAQRMERQSTERAAQLVEDVRQVKQAGSLPEDAAKILVVGNDNAFVEELCRAKQLSVEVVHSQPSRLPKLAVQFNGEWALATLTAFDAIAVVQEDPGLDMSLLELVDGEGVFVEWYC